MKILLLVACLVISSSSQEREHFSCRNSTNDDNFNYDVKCFRNKNESRSCGDDRLSIAWDIVDPDRGEISLQVLGKLCDASEYTVWLYAFKGNGSYSKDKNLVLHMTDDVDNGAIVHSHVQVIELYSGSGWPTCDEMQNVTFNMVYTGWYRIEVDEQIERDELPTGPRKFSSEPVYFETNFKRDSVSRQEVVLSSLRAKDRPEMSHVMTGFLRLQANRFRLEFWSNDHHSCSNGHTKQAELEIHVKPKSVEVQCGKDDDVECELNRQEDRIMCVLKNVTSGYHCAHVFLANNPCKEKGIPNVWKGIKFVCGIYGPPESGVHESPSRISDEYRNDFRFVLVMGVAFFVCVVASAVLIYFIYKKRRRITDIETLPPELGDLQPLQEHPQVFLMYSRDCHEFMEVMAVFRSMLKDALKWKVFDCYDPDLSEDIACAGANWAGKYLPIDNVKVLMVETKCANLHLRGHFSNFQICYKEQNNLDSYFLHSYKTLTASPQHNEYNNLFVVRITGFSSEEDKMGEITPYTRYDIPGALDDLLSSICPQYNRSLPASWTRDLQNLKEAIKKLEMYKHDNEDYLSTLLTKREYKK